jgi:hypothetical protein
MRELREHRSPIACLAIIGLMLNLVVSMVCGIPDKAGAAANSTTLIDTAELCLHDSGAVPTDDGSAPQSPLKPCPFCLTTAQIALVLRAL